jgi:hypothetical protein
VQIASRKKRKIKNKKKIKSEGGANNKETGVQIASRKKKINR